MKKLLAFTLVTMAVFAHAQNGGGGGRGQMRGGGNSMIGLLNRADVQKELVITDEQKAKLDELRPQRGQGGGGAGAGGGGNAGAGAGAGGGRGNFDPAQMQLQMAEREKKTLAILNAGQIKRLKELYIQRAGNGALSREDIQKELGLSIEQVEKIKSLQTSQREANAELMQRARNGEMDQQEARATMQKNNEALNIEIGKVLTADQTSKFKAMRGAEFKFEEGN